MTVCPMPAPRRTRILLSMVRFVVHVQRPAGMATVSPSCAALTAAPTSERLQLAARTVFPVPVEAVPQTLGVPPPPHVWGAVQLPQLNVPPQPFGSVPQLDPAGHASNGEHASIPLSTPVPA